MIIHYYTQQSKETTGTLSMWKCFTTLHKENWKTISKKGYGCI